MNTEFAKGFLIVLVLIPLMWCGIALNRYAVNIPAFDDYDVVLKFIGQSNEIVSLDLFLRQHNEHRLVVPKLVIYMFYTICGKVDFRYLAMIASVSLLIFMMTVGQEWRKESYRLWYFLPVPFLIFSPLNWKNLVWVTSGLQHLGIIPLAFLAFYLLESQRLFVRLLGVFFGVLAVFTSMSGILVPILMTLRATGIRVKHQRILLLACFFSTLVSGGLFLYGFKMVRSNEAMTFGFRHSLELISHFLIQLGGSLNHPLESWILGLIVAVLTGVFLYKRVWRGSPAVWNSYVFLLGNAAMISLGRVHFSVTQSLSPRYAVYSLSIMVAVYLLLLQSFNGKHLAQQVVAVTLIVFSVSIFIVHHNPSMKNLREHHYKLTNGLDRWCRNEIGLAYPNPVFSSAQIIGSIQKKFYEPPIVVPEKKLARFTQSLYNNPHILRQKEPALEK